MAASFSTTIPTQLVDSLSEGVIVSLYISVCQVIPWQLSVSWWSLLGALLVTDIVHYWTYRWEHEVRYHRVYHGANAKYLDRNYRGMLIIWDKFFGTLQERVAITYSSFVHAVQLKSR